MANLKFAGLAALQEMFTQNEARYAKKTELKTYSIEKMATAEEGYTASYKLVDGDGIQAGAIINIPKDFLVRSGSIISATADDNPVAGVHEGDLILDFVVNAADDSATSSHIYIPVNQLVDAYTGGNGIDVTNNEISVVVDATNANGLSVGANGLALGLASTTNAGALSAADYVKFTNAAEATITIGSPTGEGNVVTAINNVSGEIVPTLGITALQESDLSEISASEVAAIYTGSNSGGDPTLGGNEGGGNEGGGGENSNPSSDPQEP